MKKLLNVKNIFTWITALVFFIVFIVFISSPIVLKSAVVGLTNGKEDVVEYVVKYGNNTFTFADTAWYKEIVAAGGSVKTTLVVNNTLTLIGCLLVLLIALGLVSISFLKPSKLKGWLYIFCLLIAVAAIVFYVIGITQVGNALSTYNNKENAFLQQKVRLDQSLLNFVSTHFLSVKKEPISKSSDFLYFVMPGDGALIFLIAIPMVLVFPSMIIRSPREKKPEPQAEIQPQEAQKE